jgi:Xaa-Pro aminopeptidase
LSFETICGYAAHGAIVHYSATPETNSEILKSGFLLVDSGAQYTFGTTDITRTIALGKVSAEMKRDYTTVLKSHIALATAIFPEGTTGYALDMLARQPLYKQYKDYRHGTGHGVGYILNVHEGPQRINIRSLDHESTYPICPGMITSDEPGLYIDGKYGIRHENLVLCVKKKGTEYGNFCGFQPLTLVPFDLDAVDVKLLTEEEKKWLNEYHKSVYRQIAGYLNKSEQQFLKKATREI